MSGVSTRLASRLLVLVAVLVLVPAGLAACGDDEDQSAVIETTPADPGVSPEREGGGPPGATRTGTGEIGTPPAAPAGGDPAEDAASAPMAQPAEAGERYARERLRVAEPREATELPSRREPEWRLVSGFTPDGKTWAVFLRREGDGWVAVEGSSPAEPGPAEVPCDIRFPFSEPGC